MNPCTWVSSVVHSRSETLDKASFERSNNSLPFLCVDCFEVQDCVNKIRPQKLHRHSYCQRILGHKTVEKSSVLFVFLFEIRNYDYWMSNFPQVKTYNRRTVIARTWHKLHMRRRCRTIASASVWFSLNSNIFCVACTLCRITTWYTPLRAGFMAFYFVTKSPSWWFASLLSFWEFKRKFTQAQGWISLILARLGLDAYWYWALAWRHHTKFE